jgi:hypothetical protein
MGRRDFPDHRDMDQELNGYEARQLSVRAALEQMSRSRGDADAAAKRVKKSVNPAAGCVANWHRRRFRVFPIAVKPSRYHFNTVADLTKVRELLLKSS